MKGFFPNNCSEAYWVSCKKMTVLVVVNNGGYIVEAAPIVRKFVGQTFQTLQGWMRRFGGFKMARLKGRV